MLKFELRNVNPKNKKTSDCVIRAIVLASGKDYNVVLEDLYKVMKKTGYMMNEKRCYEKLLDSYGFIKIKQPKRNDNTKYLVNELDELIDSNQYDIVVSMANHLTCIKNNTIIDTWDCGRKTVSNYFVRDKDLAYMY